MTTAIDLIEESLFLIGENSQVTGADPNSVLLAFKVLVRMLERWDSLNTGLGVVIPANLDDDIEEPPYATTAIEYNLGIDIAPYLRKEPDDLVRQNASVLYSQLLAVVNPHPLPDYPDTLPVGSGNSRGPKPPVFYPPNNDLQETETGGPQILDGNP